MSVSPGTRLGGYEVTGQIGAGGMGEVYRAKDLRLGRYVAMKVLPADVVSTPERLARFEREARAVAAVNHPNIVVIYSIEEAEGTRFLTMELVEGETLDRQIGPGGLPLQKAVEIAGALVDALVAAHDQGVIHCDLKPGNIMITSEGRVKVLDFGLARHGRAFSAGTPETVQLDPTSALTSSSGLVRGTVPYMAPEQLRGEPLDPRTDLFALGVVLYELLAGRRPFTGQSFIDVSSAILRDTPLSLRDLRGDVPGDLADLVSRCLEKSRDNRPHSARHVRADLDLARRALELDSVGALPFAAFPSTPVLPGRANTSRSSAPALSIAVLPFVNRSRDQEDEYFADGLADELLTVLAKIRGLRVAARTSSFRFRRRTEDPAVIGRKLKVATILDGSVRKSGNRIRIFVQLVKADDGYQLWSETYDRTLSDIFAVQDDIAQSVVAELRATLLDERSVEESGPLRAEVERATRGRGANTEAYRLALQGRFLSMRSSVDDLARGLAILHRATELEPGNALAWAWIGWNRVVAGVTGEADLHDRLKAARAAVARALELEPDLPEAHLAMSYIQIFYDFDWAGAETSLRRAEAHGPGLAEVSSLKGQLALTLGQFDVALDACQRAAELDPLSVPAHRFLGTCLNAVGNTAGAEHACRLALELSPAADGLRCALTNILIRQGRAADALIEARLESSQWARLTAIALAAFASGDQAESDAALAMLNDRYGQQAAYQVAQVHAFRGNADEAFAWLDRAIAQRDSGLVGLKRDWIFERIRADARWLQLLRRMDLPES